jgi:glucose-6-phosphate isomerase
MQHTDLNKTVTYYKLKNYAKVWSGFDFNKFLDGNRVKECVVDMAAGLKYSWAAKSADPHLVGILGELASEQGVIQKYKALLSGENVNTGENRKVLHQLTRGELCGPVVENDKNIGDFYRAEAERFCGFAKQVHSGKHKGSSGKQFNTVVQIGIGGSDLGPRAMYLALETWAAALGKQKLAAKFISNVDPDDAASVLNSVDLAQTLFILVSKSGTTQDGKRTFCQR